ncbi:hypothetical protein DPMN_094937 [Dreissena polymorpha]|uniref:Uncharacterized protein n=1 Tax=Dreissena polymorpha TaxID=45954 RepID=A0A9D4L5Z0_DREPO|nr:hypothetical protein DPMN_094937 [Dreissena polymorpha]
MFSFHDVDSNVISTATSEIVDQGNYYIDLSDNEYVAIQPYRDFVDSDTSTRLLCDVSVPKLSSDWGLASEVLLAHSYCVGISVVSLDGGLDTGVPLAHSVGVGVPEMPCSDGGLVPEVSSDGGLAPEVPVAQSDCVGIPVVSVDGGLDPG